MATEFILASQSPFRKILLKQIGLNFKTVNPNIDERSLEKDFSGSLQNLAEHLAIKKAEAVSIIHPSAAVIGSDQVLIFQGQSLAKPVSKDEAITRLKQLQGQTHELHTGLCLCYQGKVQKSTTLARLTMHPLSDSEIMSYIERDQPLGCTGGYKIEQQGPLLFSKIETSDHFSIIGLPLLSLTAMLRELGLLVSEINS